MEINGELITYLEDLTRLTLPEDEKQLLTKELKDIVKAMALLSRLDTENPPPDAVFNNINVFREDEVTASLDRDLVLKNAPEQDGGMLITPRIIE